MNFKKVGLFSLKFFLVFGILLLLLSFTPDSFLSFQAKTVHGVLNLFSSSTLEGKTLFFDGVPFEFVPECTGFTLIALLFSLYFATSLKFNSRFIYYSIFLMVFNIFRIVLTLVLSKLFSFDNVHFIFYFVDSLVVFFIWKNEFNKQNSFSRL